jgi:ubiquinone/menaquinone biosynthesis C-methylase UbiE
MKMEYLHRCNLCSSEDIFALDKNHNIFQCNRCGYIFDNPRPTYDEIAKFYSADNKYDSWIKEEEARNMLWLRRLKMVLKYRRDGTLLDVGTGIGQFLNFARTNFEVEGTEISESAINIAAEKYNLKLIKGQLEDIYFGGRRFDIITLFHVLEHVPYPSQLMEKCYDLLRDDGILVIAVPNETASFITHISVSVVQPVKRLLSSLGIGSFRSSGKYGLQKIILDGSLGDIHLSHFDASVLKKWLTQKHFDLIEDTLDPYFAAKGVAKIAQDIIYYIFLAIKKVSGSNFYPTIWIAARKKKRS